MILMQAPGPNMTFGAMPSGATYVSTQYSLIMITKDSTADQAALAAAGCFTVQPMGGWGTFGFSTLANMYAADTATNLVLPGIIGFPTNVICQVTSDPAAANDGSWIKTGTGNGVGNWTYSAALPNINSINAAVTSAQNYAALAALAASVAESLSGPVYANTAAGITATTSGTYFAVNAGTNLVSIYLNSSGTAVLQRTLATSAALAALSGSSLIGANDHASGASFTTVQSFIDETLANGIVLPTVAALVAAHVPITATSITLAGYYAAGDGGGALYTCSGTAGPGAGLVQSADGQWWAYAPIAGQINVLCLGADPTGLTSSDNAFQSAFTIFSNTRKTWAYADALSQAFIYVPCGQYLINQSESIVPSSYVTKTTGFCMRGSNVAQSNIVFSPAYGSKVLIYNNAFLNCQVENITFVGTGLDQTFYRADETTNAQQGWNFIHCNWIGTWGKGFYLTGSNNNSEYMFENCRGSGQMYEFIYLPSTSATPAGSDQFLNYNFLFGAYWFGFLPGGTAGSFTGSITGNVLTVTAVASGVLAPGQTVATPAAANVFSNTIAGQYDRVPIVKQLTGTTGGIGTYQVANCVGTVSSTTLANLTNDANCMLNLGSGGHANFHFTDFSGWQSGTLFQLRGYSHSYGVCSFTTKSCRYELKSYNLATMYCEWPQGVVSFDGDDWSSQSNNYYNADGSLVNCFYFSGQNTVQPSVSWRSCQLIGKISISHGANGFAYESSFLIDLCTHSQISDVYSMFSFITSTNDFGSPSIQLNSFKGLGFGSVSNNPVWQPLTAYAVGNTVASDGGNSSYKCISAGTSGSQSAALSASISGTTLTVASVSAGTVSVGQKITGQKNAVFVGATATSTTVTIASLTSGQLAIGQIITGPGIPNGTTIVSLGTYNGASGTIMISQPATATAGGLTLSSYGTCVLEDTIIIAGSGTNWTVNRSQSAQSQSMSLLGGPQSASMSIPDGSAVWTWVNNNTRDYFTDGNAISPNFSGMPNKIKSKRRVAEFGGLMPTNNSGSYGAAEIIIPPNSIIIGAYCIAPSGAVSSGYYADYLIECDDGTTVLKVLTFTPCSAGFSVSSSSLSINVGLSSQRRKLKLVAGGAGGGTIDQNNQQGRVWVEYII